MICNECGGVLVVKDVEEVPQPVKDKLNYQRVCDVECIKCKKVYYSQPYDSGSNINVVRKI